MDTGWVRIKYIQKKKEAMYRYRFGKNSEPVKRIQVF